jgi:GT2 family glycosyltransferase
LAVALLVVNYHVYEELDRALTSIEPFLRPGDEVVVVDQESERDRIDGVRRRHPRATFVPTDRNVGFAAGVNLAARASTAPYVLLLNPDCVMEEPVIERLERYLLDHPRAGIVGPRVLNDDGTLQASARRFPGPSTAFAGRTSWLTRRFPGNWLSQWNLPAQQTGAPVAVDWIAGSCFMTRRSLFDALNGLDESFFLYWEDADFCRRAAEHGWERVYWPGVSVRHAGGRSAASNPAAAIRAFHVSAFRLYEKQAGPLGRAIAPVTRLALWLRGEMLVRKAQHRHHQYDGYRSKQPPGGGHLP